MADAWENSQTRAIFIAEAERITKAERKITWNRPSRGEVERSQAPLPRPIFTDPEAVDRASEIERFLESADHELCAEVGDGEWNGRRCRSNLLFINHSGAIKMCIRDRLLDLLYFQEGERLYRQDEMAAKL